MTNFNNCSVLNISQCLQVFTAVKILHACLNNQLVYILYDMSETPKEVTDVGEKCFLCSENRTNNDRLFVFERRCP